MNRPFHRMRTHRQLGGVCSGLAYALGIQTNIVRVVAVIAMILSVSVVFWGYIIVWVVVDEWDTDPLDFATVTGDVPKSDPPKDGL